MVKHRSNQYAQDDRGTGGVAGNQEQRQQLGFVTNLGNGYGKGRCEKSIHSERPPVGKFI